MSDLLYSEAEEALRTAVRKLFAERCPPELVARLYDPQPPDFSPVWRTLAIELGAAGLLVPESLGGAGASVREAAVVAEEIGRAVAPVPFLSSAVLATSALLAAGDTGTVGELAAGARTAALAVPLTTGAGDPISGVAAGSDGLTGTVTSVADAALADVLVVPVAGAGGLELHVVAADVPGVRVTSVVALDMTRPLADIQFTGAASTRVDTRSAAPALQAALQSGSAVLAAEQLGLAQWCLDTTLAYIKGRRQFGRVIGSYQAIKHRVAEMWLQVGNARAAARYAADTCARRDIDAPIAVAVASSYCSDVAVRVAEECIQLHGGIGMTWEYPAHLYLKRAKADQLALGTGYRHRVRLGELVDLPVS